MAEFEIVFWTNKSNMVQVRVIKARSEQEAIRDAEDLYPNWDVLTIKEIKAK